MNRQKNRTYKRSKQTEAAQVPMMTDPESFDFGKWEQCIREVLDQTPELLLTEGDRQGEPVLRAEIADYLHRVRGVV